MADMIKVKPGDGRDTLMEDGREWPKGGAMVEKTLYIRRRLNDGDLVEVAPKAKSLPETLAKGDK